MIKPYRIKIEIPELDMDYDDSCESTSREEAAKVFWMQLPENMKSIWLYGILETYILTQSEKELYDSLDINPNI